jgi:hypothetical protein
LAIQEGEVSYYHYLSQEHANIFPSAFIRDLITFPSDQALDSSPIELDHNSKIARYFIDFVMSGSTSTTQISMSEFEELFKLSDKFMAEKVEKPLLAAMGLRVQQRPTPQDLNPWTVFKFAAGRDAYEFARSCIRAFENARIRHADIHEARVSKFEGIPSNYLAGLLLAGIDYRRPYVNKPDLFLDLRSWDEVADEFYVK